MTMTIREGMPDSEMSMYGKFKEEMRSFMIDFGVTPDVAAKIVMYRERTDVLDHRLSKITDQLGNLGYLRGN